MVLCFILYFRLLANDVAFIRTVLLSARKSGRKNIRINFLSHGENFQWNTYQWLSGPLICCGQRYDSKHLGDEQIWKFIEWISNNQPLIRLGKCELLLNTYLTPSIFNKSISRSSNDMPWGTESIRMCIDSLKRLIVVIITITENSKVHNGSRTTALGCKTKLG